MEPAGKTVRVVTETVEHREEPAGAAEIELEPVADVTDDEERDALADLEALAGTGARFEIRRTAPAGFTGYVGTYQRDTFSPDLLQSEWGGGNFTLRVKNSRGEYVGSRQIVLAGEAHHKAAPPVPVVSQQSHGGSAATELAPILKAMQESSNSQIALLTSLVTGLINKPAPVPPPATDPLDIIEKLAPILRPEKGGGNDAGDAVKLLLQGVELGKELGGGGGGEAGFADVMLKGLDTVKGLAASHPVPSPRPTPKPVPRSAGNVPAQEPVRPAPVNPEASPMVKLLQWMNQQVKLLVYQAARGKSPALYAELFLDNLPPFLTEAQVRERMTSETALDDLAGINAEVLQYRPWFEEFRRAVLELIDGPPLTDIHVDTAEESGEDQIDVGTGGTL